MGAGEVRAFLTRHGLRALQSLGQNFLVDRGVAERLVEVAGVQPGDSVIEIGAGLGQLTRALAGRAARVVTLEIDSGLVEALRADAVLPEGVELVHADAMDFDLRALAQALPPPVRLVANLPYSVSGPLLRRLLDLRGVLTDWSVMVQREVAARLLAQPGSRTYGSLSVLHGLTVTLSREMALEPRCFFPVPRVKSSFLRMRPLPGPGLSNADLERVEVWVRAAFSARRKTLANALGAHLGRTGDASERVRAALEAAGINPRARAETLVPEQFLRLSELLEASEAGP